MNGRSIPYSLGIDFGTTNTVLALAEADGPARLVQFPTPEGELFAFRSCLSFHAPAEAPSDRQVAAGPWAIEAYVEDPAETRFIQSFKSFAAQESFTETQILGRRYRFEDLLSTFLLKVRDYAGAELGALPERVIVGRPVRFVGGSPNEALALSRYETAFHRMGVKEVLYAYEPVGAAFFFARELDHDATVLVGDFGGGTSDFSIIRFERHAGEVRAIPLGRAGVGVAGDAFDYRIIDNLVSPELGKGGDYVSFGKTLPIPYKYYAAFARWDQLAMLRASRDMREIRALAREAVEPGKIAALIEVLDENYGYQLYRSVSRLKESLSASDGDVFRFEAGSIGIVKPVARADFEGWIAPELAQIEAAVDAALADADLTAERIDRVFLTGGSSLVPAVRAIFHRRFPSDRIETGAELESIASGLALMARERDLSRWTMGAPSLP
ncbi:Hsp70 family protein [Phenylobacterium sp.]|uniref:Hsp70 family protein n=1 Tax=Phenylobacterium sp. TaxID=1871053 RepID=UPI0025E2BCF7|nr:Hsp70 family protein [Phenylobacterium sp.]MBX3483695.1 Hsp70 family protein [Phenylobacterium sp.]MCW5759064.1 Hsp70 family protein [Phenylobacterium sp.]